jgi:hypothetical protein
MLVFYIPFHFQLIKGFGEGHRKNKSYGHIYARGISKNSSGLLGIPFNWDRSGIREFRSNFYKKYKNFCLRRTIFSAVLPKMI